MTKSHAFLICMAIQDIGVMGSGMKPVIPPTDRYHKQELRIADTGYITRFSHSFDHLNLSVPASYL